MKFRVVLISVLASLVWLNTTLAERQVSVDRTVAGSPAAVERLSQTYGKLPLSFEVNRGQRDGRVKFLARGDGYALFLTGQEAVLKLRSGKPEARNPQSAILKMSLAGTKASPKVSGVERLPGRGNYFLGNDTSRWQTGIESFAKVKYESVYPGVDLIWHGNQRQLEYDFVVAPGARAEKIEMDFSGVQALTLDGDGSLTLRAEGADVRMLKPVAWQEVDGARREVRCAYRIKGNRVTFRLGEYDAGRSLVIDPVLVYSTYIGGAGVDEAYGIAVDGEGSAYLAGVTDSADFPGASPIQQNKGSGTDVFVMKLNPAGNAVVYATWLGGGGLESVRQIKVDAAGGAVVVGSTSSLDFPLKDALQTTRSGASDAFVVRLNPAGSALVSSTLLGGSGGESGNGVALDAGGNLYLTGSTDSVDFPTANPLQATKQGSPLYASTNAASTWNAASSGLAALQTNDLAVDPSNPAIVYAATERGVFKTVNGGAVWAKAGSQFNLSVSQLVIDPTAPMTIYAFNFSALYKSTDGGNSWTVLPAPGPIVSLAIAATSPVTLYAATVNSPLRSTDGGLTWTPISTIRPPFGGSPRIQTFAVDPSTPTTVYAGGSQAVYKTTDGGTIWLSLSGFPQGVNITVNRLLISRSNPSVLFALIGFGAIFRTTNGGANWEPVPPPTTVVNALPILAIDPADANTIYASIVNSGVFKSTDGGRNWLAANNGLNTSNVIALVAAAGSPQTLYAGTASGNDLFLAKINAAGSALVYSTYLGGSDQDSATGLTVDASGNAYLVGTTQSRDFPTATAYQSALKGFSDAFALKVNPSGSALIWSTYLGGDGTDSGNGLAINSAGNLFITGTTNSTNFPTVNAVQPARSSSEANVTDVFVTRFSADGRALDYSTYLGGSRFDFATNIAVDATNNAFVTGFTASADFPLAGAAQTIIDRNPDTVTNPNSIAGDAFVTRMAADGRTFVYSTFLGGRGSDQGNAIAVDAMGNAYVAGNTSSSDFPLTPNPLRATFSVREAFVAKLAISADLSAAINDEPDPVQVNGNLSYIVTIANDGPDAASGVTATIALPQSLMFVSANASQGSCAGAGPVNCALGNLAAGGKATIALAAKPAAAGNITVQATASSATPDINSANNTASQTTKVSTLPSIFGRVTAASDAGLGGVTMNLAGAQFPAVTTSDNGRYQFAELAAGGNYTVTPARQGYVFNPASRAFNDLTSDQRGDFSAVVCIFSVSPSNRVFPPVGGAASVMVNSPDPQCPWTARSNAAWIKLDGAVNGVVSGNGSRAVGFTVEPAVGARSGTITLAGQTFTVLQEFNACVAADFSTSPVIQLPQAGFFQRILTADFNKDGLPDLAAINNNLSGSPAEAALLIYPGNATGGFGAPIKAMMLQGSDASFVAFAAGDLNGDGFPDLAATGGSNQNRIFVVLSNGSGGFAQFKEYAATLPLSAVATGDFNSDNKPDVAFGVRSFEANVIVHLNDGAGNLGDPKILPKSVGSFPVDQVEVADFDGDNKLDIISFSQGPEFVVYKSDGAGNFSPQTQILPPAGSRVVGDFNGDRRPDVLFSGFNELILYLNNGAGMFGAPLHMPLSFPFISGQSGLIAGDFNGDGKTDAGVFPSNSTNSYNEGMLLFTSIGNGSFNAPVWYLPVVGGSVNAAGGLLSVANDFNRDGLTDLLFVRNNSVGTSSVTIAMATKSGGFDLPRMFRFSSSDSSSQSLPSAIAAADLNGDGVVDLATANFSSASISLLFGNGRGEFGGTVAIPTGFDPGSGAIDLAIRDFNRDGNRDLAVLSASANTIVILPGNGRGEFTRLAPVQVGPNARQLGVADFNNDGNLDLVARGQGGGLALFIGNGQGGFTPGLSGIGGNITDFDLTFVIGDFNGDTNADLALADGTQSGEGPQLIVLAGNGQGGFGAAKNIRTDTRYNLLAAEDFNADGKTDLLYQFGNSVFVLLSEGSGSFSAPAQYPVSGDTRSASVRDVNGDAKPDIIAASQSSDQLFILIGKGDGKFNNAVITPLPGLPARMAVEDFNGDGSVDLAVVRGSSTIGAILLNRASCPPAGAAVATSAASYARYNLAPESIAAVFGAGLASTTQVAASVPLPTQLAGTSVRIKDSAGVERAAPLFFVSPNQINLQIPPAAAIGTTLLSVMNGNNAVAAGTMTINRAAPALFSADASGQGFAAAVILRVKSDGRQIFEPVTTVNAIGQLVGVPIDLGGESDQVFLLLFGTGIRGNTGLANVAATIGGTAVEVQYAGAQGDFVGLDQFNLKLSRSLAGQGLSTVALTVDGKAANLVRVTIK